MPVQNSYIDEFLVQNNTKRPITLGDLVNVEIPARQTVNLLSFPRVTKEKINQSKHLQTALENQYLSLIKINKIFKNDDEKSTIISDVSTIDDAIDDILYDIDEKLVLSDVLSIRLDEFSKPLNSLDLNNQQSINFVIENRTSDPSNPSIGQIWLRTDL